MSRFSTRPIQAESLRRMALRKSKCNCNANETGGIRIRGKENTYCTSRRWRAAKKKEIGDSRAMRSTLVLSVALVALAVMAQGSREVRGCLND